jgi:NADH-quinone oxidoreductase subunit D
VRVLFDELSRVLNHLLTLSATSLDLSAMGPIFWAFEEREQIMELFERVSGARMHTALYRPFNFDWSALTATFFTDLGKFLTRCGRALSGAFLGLLNNRVLKTRLASVGALSPAKLQSYGITGVIGRSAGLLTDLRLQRTTAYGAYWHLSFRSFTGRRGDNLDRFLIRIKEVVESFRLVSQAMATLRGLRPTSTAQSRTTVVDRQAAQRLTPRCSHNWLWALLGVTSLAAPEAAADPKLTLNHPIWALAPAAHFNARSKFVGMEDLIAHFRLMSEGYVTAPGFAYQAVEGPKGEMGVTFVSTGTSKPTRAKLRSPVAHNMHLLPSLANGVLFADFVATFCSLDIVLGEIDR